MIILGVDPGCRISGYSVIYKSSTGVQLRQCGYLSMPATRALPERVAQFHDFFKLKITEHNVTHIALETPFLGKNSQSFLKLGYLRGILYLLSVQHTLELIEFTPSQVKQALTGYGAASKEQVSYMVLKLFPTMSTPAKFDISDAVAVGLCGAWQTDSRLTYIR